MKAERKKIGMNRKRGRERLSLQEVDGSMLNTRIGRKIRERRLELKVSQQELADRLGYKHKTSVTKIEKGKTDIPLSKLVLIGKLLKIDFCKELNEV